MRDYRIRSVKVHQLNQELEEGLNWCAGKDYRNLKTSVVEVELDNGMVGWGDGHVAVDRLRENLEFVLGKTPFEAEVIFHQLGGSTRKVTTSGALDIALWDLQGKILDKPVHQLLGPVWRDRVLAYASVCYLKDSWTDPVQGFVDDALASVEKGYKAIKMKTGLGREFDWKIIKAVREAIGPDIKLCVDSGSPGVYDGGTAIGLGRQLEQLDLEFWEEPVEQYDFESYARLRQGLRMPIASGEGMNPMELIEFYINRRAVDIVQPDINIYGFTAGRWVLDACRINRVRLVPHTWAHTPIRIAATLHWLACSGHEHPRYVNPPAPMLELHPPHESVCWELTDERLELDPTDGCIAIPQDPGLGLTVHAERLDSYCTELLEFE